MTIAGVTCGARSSPAFKRPRWWTSVGLAMSGLTTALDFGVTEYDITITFKVMPKSIMDSLEAALTAIKPGNLVTVTPDTGDDLGAGVSGASSLVFLGFQADWLGGDRYTVVIQLKKYV